MKRKNTKGFTLVELLIIVGIIILAGMVLINLKEAKEEEKLIEDEKEEIIIDNESIVCGQDKITDLEGNTYDTVEIGGLCWMAENLKYLPEVHDNAMFAILGTHGRPSYGVNGYNGSDLESAKDYSVRIYGEEMNVYNTDGVLYNWWAAMEACPPGTHLPTDEEWHRLELSLTEEGNDCDGARSNSFGCHPAGTALKSDTINWLINDGDNSSGFNALPAGSRDWASGMFGDSMHNTFFWSSSEGVTTDEVWNRGLNCSWSGIHRYSSNKARGFSVRCVQ